MTNKLSSDAQAVFEAESREAAEWYRGRYEEVQRLRAEIAALRNERDAERASARLHAGLLREVAIALGMELGDDRSALPALVSELRKDAERYRWLRVGRMEFGVQPGDPDNPPKAFWRWYVDFEPDEADRIIDAAMARGAG